MSLPAHIIEHLNSADERREQAVLDASIRARYEERDRFKEERGLMGAAVKILALLRYDPRCDWYVITSCDIHAHNLSRFLNQSQVGCATDSTLEPASGLQSEAQKSSSQTDIILAPKDHP